jgi:hypothetical protein
LASWPQERRSGGCALVSGPQGHGPPGGVDAERQAIPAPEPSTMTTTATDFLVRTAGSRGERLRRREIKEWNPLRDE